MEDKIWQIIMIVLWVAFLVWLMFWFSSHSVNSDYEFIHG